MDDRVYELLINDGYAIKMDQPVFFDNQGLPVPHNDAVNLKRD